VKSRRELQITIFEFYGFTNELNDLLIK